MTVLFHGELVTRSKCSVLIYLWLTVVLVESPFVIPEDYFNELMLFCWRQSGGRNSRSTMCQHSQPCLLIGESLECVGKSS